MPLTLLKNITDPITPDLEIEFEGLVLVRPDTLKKTESKSSTNDDKFSSWEGIEQLNEQNRRKQEKMLKELRNKVYASIKKNTEKALALKTN